MAGEIPHKDQHAARRPWRGKQHIAVKDGLRRGVITDIGGIQATGVGHVVEYPLGDFLLFRQLPIPLPDQIPLIRQGLMHQPHAVKRLDLRFDDDPVVGFAQKVIATGLKTAGQSASFRQGRQKD